MKLFAIADLHLGFSLNKPMNIFGDNWEEHHQKIKRDWYKQVRKDDLVIVAGDISWAMRMEEAAIDLEWIDALPGHKFFVKGNHDYWWQSLAKMQDLYEGVDFLFNNAYRRGSLAIAGTRGWLLPGTDAYQAEDEKIYLREVARLERSLQMAVREPVDHLVVAFHYPPIHKDNLDTEMMALLKRYGVHQVVYGHLHDAESWQATPQGRIQGIDFHLVACDYLDFKVKKIWESQ